jgi:hypothetical protein
MLRRILFELEQDEDGYPPVGAETVWATHDGENRYVIDNTPFFATAATLGDVVEATEEDGMLRYKATIKRSGNSLIRIVYCDGTDPSELRNHLKTLGCSTEWDENHHLIALNIPPSVNLEEVQAFLRQGLEQERWDYEAPILMQ